jgi:hypothetical protein
MDEVAGIQDDFVGQDRRQGSREAHPIGLSSAEDRRGTTGAVGAVQGEARKESCIECFGYATKPATSWRALLCGFEKPPSVETVFSSRQGGQSAFPASCRGN